MTETRPAPTELRVTNQTAQAVMMLFGVLVAVLGAAGLFNGEWGAGALLPVGVLLAYRGATSPVVCASPERVRYRTIVWTRTIPMATVGEAEIAEGVTGMNSGIRTFLALRLNDGSTVQMKEVNFPIKNRGTELTAVRDAIRGWTDDPHGPRPDVR